MLLHLTPKLHIKKCVGGQIDTVVVAQLRDLHGNNSPEPQNNNLVKIEEEPKKPAELKLDIGKNIGLNFNIFGTWLYNIEIVQEIFRKFQRFRKIQRFKQIKESVAFFAKISKIFQTFSTFFVI